MLGSLTLVVTQNAVNMWTLQGQCSRVNLCKSLEQYVKITPEAQKVTEAECLMTNFIVEHNLPISVADHMSDLIKRMCPDSKIAKQYQCKRTKTTHIVHAMAEDVISSISSDIKNGPL